MNVNASSLITFGPRIDDQFITIIFNSSYIDDVNKAFSFIFKKDEPNYFSQKIKVIYSIL